MKAFQIHNALMVIGDEVADLERKAAFILREEVNKRSRQIIDDIIKSSEFSEKMLGKYDTIVLLGSRNKNITLEKILEKHNIGQRLNSIFPNPEGFWIKAFLKDRLVILIVATDSRGILYGVGRLLRELKFSTDHLEIGEMEFVDEPCFKVRGMVLASHHNEGTINRRNVYADWSISQWKEYLKELSLWGLNTVAVYPVNFHLWKGINPWGNPPEWTSRNEKEHWERDWEVQKRIPEIAKSYGMRYGIWVPANNVFPEQVVPAMDPVGQGAYGVCPSVPMARRVILSDRRKIFEELSCIDFLFVPSADDGGCPCNKCAPWVMTYLKLVEETKDILQEYHPRAKIWLSNQGLTHQENELLYSYLYNKKPEWIEYVVYGPGSDELSSYIRGFVDKPQKGYEYKEFGPLSYYLKEMHAKLPFQYKIMLYPDITHIVRCQYPIEGIDTSVVNVFRRYGELVRPCETAKIFKETIRYAVGCAPYSEGIYDEINKWVTIKLGRNPRRGIRDIISEYCKRYFGEEVADETTEAIFKMEKNWEKPVKDNEEIDNVVELLGRAERKMSDFYKDKNWRWKILLVRGYLDYLIKFKLKYEREIEKSVHTMLTRILQNEEVKDMRGELSEAVSFLESNLGYLKKNEIYNKVSSLKKEIFDLATLDVPACDAINYPFYNLDWTLDRLKTAAESDDRGKAERIVEEVISYEDPGEDGFYDDCGNSAKQPRLKKRINFADWRSFVEKGLLDAQNRPSQNDAVIAEGENKEIIFFYENLDPTSEYKVKVTYVQPKGRGPKYQRLDANGFQVHGPLKIPVYTAKHFAFLLPKHSYREGSTSLSFRKTGGYRPAAVSEIWLYKVGKCK